MKPGFDLDKIKFGVDEGTWEKALGLYETGKVKNFQDTGFTFVASVQGTHLYKVIVSKKQYTDGDCDCYLGQNDTLCKHMVAVAIRAATGGKPLSDKDKQLVKKPVCSSRLGMLSKEELLATKLAISAAKRYIKPYNGPSRIWFAYQDTLMEGCNRLSAIVSALPVSEQTARLLVDLLLRLDKKLSVGGVDDSDGTLGGFIEEVVSVLKEYARLDPSCTAVFHKLKDKKTCFGWEKPLLKLVKK